MSGGGKEAVHLKGNRFYSVPYDARNDPAMKILRLKQGGIVAYGRWQALLGILYDMDGAVDLKDEAAHRMIEAELELKPDRLDEFVQESVAVKFLDAGAWELGWASSGSVKEQLARQESQSDRRKGKTQAAQLVDELVEAGLLDRAKWEEYEARKARKRK